MDPRVQIIRMVLACVVSLVLWHVEPWWCWVPVALMMPAFSTPSCGTSPTFACSGATPTQASVTLAGMANQVCSDCGSFNATWNLPFFDDLIAACRFDYGSSLPCSYATNGSLRVAVGYSVSNTIVEVQLTCNAAAAHRHLWDDVTSFGPSPVDCSAFGTVNPPFVSDNCTECDSTSATAQVVFS